MRNTGTGYVNFTTIEAALAAREDFTSKPTNQVPRHHTTTAPPLHYLHSPHHTAPLHPSPHCTPHHATPPLLCSGAALRRG